MASVADIPKIKCSKPFPSYFISHGGPSLIDPNDSFTEPGAYNTIKEIGKEILGLKPDYLIIVSGHYQAEDPGTIEISVGQDKDHTNSIIYDFYGFPKRYYRESFKSKSSTLISLMLYNNIKKFGLKPKLVNRGLDHGVWCPMKVMFGEELNIPLIQVSLPHNDDFAESYKLGQVLQFFRKNLIWDPENSIDLKGLIIGSGSSVHNLKEFRNSFGTDFEFVDDFHDLIEETFNKSTHLTVLQNLNNWKKDSNYSQLLYRAHPTLDHFLPLVVAAGTDDKNDFEELYRSKIGTIGFGYYKFGHCDCV